MSKKVIHLEEDLPIPFRILRWIRENIAQAIIGTIIGAWCLSYVLFFVWAVIASFKDPVYFEMSPIGISFNPIDWNPRNYVIAIKSLKKILPSGETVYMPTMLRNSLMYCLGNAIFPTTLTCVTTYVVNKYKHFRWTQILWGIYLVVRFMPFNADTGSELKLMQTLGVYNNMVGNWIYNCGAFGSGFLLYLGCWRTISNTYIEAAEMDGAGPLTVFFKIMLPQTFGLFFVLCLTSFSGLWDDYMAMLIYLPSWPTIASGAFSLQFSVEPGASDITTKLAGLFALSLPVMIIYFAMRSRIVKAMSMAGGLKG